MTVRYYSSTAGKMSLVGGITNASTSIVVDQTVGLPGSTPFTIILEPGTNAEEICDVTAVGGTTLTVTRGVDGSTAQAHNSGSEVRHGITARDFSDSRTHENSTAGAHGTSGNVVGTTSAQTLTNKSMDGTANTFTNIPKSAIPSTTAYTTDVQTFTNKTMDGGANTFTNIPKGAIPGTTAYTDAANVFNGGTQTFQSSGAANVPLISKGTTGQTGDLQQWQDTTGAVKAKVDSSGNVSGGNLGSGLLLGQQLGAADMKNNFTFANASTEYPQFVKRNGVVTMTGRVRQTAGFTGGSAWNIPTAYLPDPSYPWAIPLAIDAFNGGSAVGAPIVGYANVSSGDVSFSLLSGGAAWTANTWIGFSATWHAATP